MGAVLGVLVACVPPAGSPPEEGSTGPGPGTSSGTGSSSSTGLAPATFGMEGPGDGSEVGFVPPVDLSCAGVSPGLSAHCALCDVREQNCIDGFKCVPWAEDGGDGWTGTRCIDDPLDPVGVGEPCTITGWPASGQDDCAAGSMCWGVEAFEGQGTCVPFCAPVGQRPECPAGTGCMIDGPEALALCLPPCDPLEPSPCPPQQSCRYLSNSGAFCIPDGGGQVQSTNIQCGDEGEEVCPADEVCISASTFGGCGSPRCCSPWCDRNDPGADAQCDAAHPGHVCRPLFDREPAPKALAHLGYCGEPP